MVAPILAASLAVATEPVRYLQAWNGPPMPGLTGLQPLPPPSTPGPGVVVLLVDGLGRSPALKLPQLKALRKAGADVTIQAAYPSKSRPAYITLLTGTPPALHGGRNNRTPGEHGLDTLLARARAAGMTTACVGDRLGWFAELAAGGCDVARTTQTDGDFVRAADDALASDAKMVFLHWLGVDWSGHAHGGASGQYGAAARDADALVKMIVERARGRVVAVVADHGHAAHGGHGGNEPEVLEVPLVLSGPGVRGGVQAQGRAHDVAPTLALLAGVALPAASVGKPIWDALHPDTQRAQGDHVNAVRSRVDQVSVPKRRTWVRGGLTALAALALLLGVRKRTRWALVGLLVPGCALILLAGRGDPLSLSAVDQAPRFVARLMGYSAPAAALGALALVRSVDRTREAALRAVAFVVGAAGPWLISACWAGFRPYPQVPGPLEGFLPVALAIPAVLGMFAAALCVPLAAWSDPGS